MNATTNPRRRPVATTLRALAGAAAGVALLAACSASSGGASSMADEWAGGAGGADGEVGVVDEYYDAADAGGMPLPEPAPGGVAGAERSIIQRGYVAGTAEDPVAAAATVATIVGDGGGRVESQTVVTAAERRHPEADLTVRVPTGDLDGVLAQIGDVIDVVRSELTADDVTAQVVDLDARIRAKELSIERLEALLAEAETTADVIAAEENLTWRQTELEQLLTQRKGYSDAVEMATLSVSITVPSQAPVTRLPGFSGGLTSGWDSLMTAASGALVVVGFLIPWLAVAAVVAGIVVVIRRARRTSRSTTTTTQAAPEPGAPDADAPAADAES